ncbi:DUF2798 domain-containing protein [Carnobacterium sp. ISL-102]
MSWSSAWVIASIIVFCAMFIYSPLLRKLQFVQR